MDSSEDSADLKKLQSEYRQARLAFKRDELFCNLINECAQDPTIDPALRNKIKRLDLVAHSESYLNSGSACSLLGLENPEYTELEYLEKQQIRTLLELKIQNLYEKAIVQKREKRKHNENSNLLDLHKQIIEQMGFYQSNLLKHHKQLKDLWDARVKVLPDVTNRVIEQCSLNHKIAQQKMKMLTEKVRVNIFLEIPPTESFEAYKILMDDINKQQVKCKSDNEELTALLQKYELASCKEYDNILTTYLQYKKSLNKLKLAFNH